MKELHPNIIDNRSILMKHIHKLLMCMFFIATFGFGQPTFIKHTITDSTMSTSADGATSVYAADVDGDGNMDVLSASYWDAKIAWYGNDGSESFTEHTISTSASGVNDVHAADVDGDGDIDVLTAAINGDEIAWYEQEGSVSIIEDVIPLTYSLYNAYPNPFNPVKTLSYDLPDDGIVNITIYDIVGRQVKALLNSPQTAGHRSIQWNATNNAGQQVPG